jgi:hypothetical protein
VRANLEKATPADELEHDRRAEQRIFWKGVGALLVTVAVVCVRQRYFL